MIDRQKWATWILYAVLFFLPWQTRWIFQELTLGGDAWEYGKLSLYATECLLALSLLLRGMVRPVKGAELPVRYGVVLMGACIISLTFAVHTGLTAAMLLHVAFAFALFLSVLDYRVIPRQAMTLFVAGLIIPSFLGWYQVMMGSSPSSTLFGLSSHEAVTAGASVVETETGRVLRAYGPFPHPNVFGGFLAVGALMLGVISHRAQKRSERAGLMIPSLVLGATLVITFSRSAWLSLIAGIVVLALLMLMYRRMPPHDALPLAALGLFSATITLFIFHDVAFTRFQPSARLEARSLSERSSEYHWIDDVVLANPITGTGVGGFTAELARVRPDEPAWSYQPIHNTFLLILAEIGIVGFVGFVRWFISIDQITHRVRHKALGMFGMALGTVILVLGLFDHYLWSSWSGLALAAFCFALMVRWGIEDQDQVKGV